jgi:RNA recognition motif-containing protein
MSTKLHVGNIPSTVLEDDLQAIFAKFGPVDTVEIARDSGTGLSRGFAIVAMAREQDDRRQSITVKHTSIRCHSLD